LRDEFGSKMDSFWFIICLLIVLVLAFILIRDTENKIIFEVLGLIEEIFKSICELLKQKEFEIGFKDYFHLKTTNK